MNKPNWLDSNEYPFSSHYSVIDGRQMHYVDEGNGEVVLLIHGTPSWSFDYRNVIKELSKTNRCIAPDHIGFGLSEKPADYTYSTQKHSQNLTEFIKQMGLKNITLVVHDFGGPIGINYAIEHAHNIKRLVILNTWLFSTKNEPEYKQAEFILKSPLLPILYKYFNFSAAFMVPQSWGDRKKLTAAHLAHFKNPFQKPSDRLGTLSFAQSLLSDQEWFETIWDRLSILNAIPTLIVWGEKDKFIPVKFAERLQQKLTNSTLLRLQAGHFVQDEAAVETTQALQQFLSANP